MRLTLFIMAVVFAACDPQPSGLEVVVEAEREVVARTNRILFEVRTQEGDVALSETFNVEQTPFPIRRLVTPRGGDVSRIVTITAQAVNSNGDTLTTARMIRSFVAGRTVEVRLRLYELCLGTNCPEGLTCEPINGRAECIDARVLETSDAGTDASDGSVGDGSTDCAAGFQRCGEVCVPANTPNACGPSCAVCPSDSRGTALCSQGSCIVSCNQGLTPCATSNGQRCVDRQTDRNHCGMCGRVCPGEQLCVNQDCVEPPQCDVNNPASCVGLTYCNPNNNRCAPGCDERLSDQCGSNETCTNRQCECSTGFHDCSGVCLSNSSVNSCGQSCSPCPLAANATQMGCDGTSCTVQSCLSGYQPSSNGQSCEDINECLTNNGGCHADATCTNAAGGRTCACNPGFGGDGFTCMPVTLSDWEVDAFIKASNTGTQDEFGVSVALSSDGSTLAVGAINESSASGINGTPNESALGNGAIYVFTRTGVGWSQEAFIKVPNTGAGDGLGMAVSLSSDGNTLAASALFEDSSVTGVNAPPDDLAFDSGAVYVFTRSNGTWNQQAFIKASNTGVSDHFGYSVELSSDGNTLAVGAPREDSGAIGVNGSPNDSASNSGAVYVFTRSNGNWSQQAFIKASNTDAGDGFGLSVALSSDGNTLAVAAYLEDSSTVGINGAPNAGAMDSGAVYVFVRANSVWNQQAFIKASNPGVRDQFGETLALAGDGNTLAVGAYYEDSATTDINGTPDDSATNSGAVYVFARSNGNWSQQAFVKASNAEAGDGFGQVALSSDGNILAVGAYEEDSSTTGVTSIRNNDTRNSGAVYLFTRSNGTWSEQAFIKASNTGSDDRFGTSVSLSGDGRTLAVGAYHEDSATTGINGTPDDSAMSSGAVYTYLR